MINIKKKYSNENLDPSWDHQKVSYNTNKYNWHGLFLEATKKKYKHIKDLQLLHEYLDTSELIEFRKHLEKFTKSKQFSSLVDQFVSEILEGRYEHKEYMIQATPGLRIVVPNQIEKNRLLAFHTGHWTGYDNGTGTIWTPITPAFDTNTMQVTDWDTSQKLMEQIHQNKWKLDKIQQECEKVSWPVDVKVGESWLFNQGHLHGNVNNNTGLTRLSFDVRVAHKEISFGHRRPGSYYRFPKTVLSFNQKKIDTKRPWVAFVTPNDQYLGMAPYFMIREYLLQWCKELNIKPNEWSNEYHECEWMPKFTDFISKKIQEFYLLVSIIFQSL